MFLLDLIFIFIFAHVSILHITVKTIPSPFRYLGLLT